MSEEERIEQAKRLLMGALEPYIGRRQREELRGQLKALAGWAVADKLLLLGMTVQGMPKTYEQASLGEEAVVYLHYRLGNVQAWITERDKGDADPLDNLQHQATGYVNLYGGGFGDAELGYVCIQEYIETGVRLDLDWKPVTVKALRAGDGAGEEKL